jgi:hypothetical protein
VGELDPAPTAATLSPGGVMITTPAAAGPSRARPPPFFLSSCGQFPFSFYFIILIKSKMGFYVFAPSASIHPAGGRG